MRLATFNIHHGTVAKHGRVDPERLGRVCAGLDADVLALQEVDQGTLRGRGADLASVVAEACGMSHVFGRSRWYPGGAYGNALLVRGDIESWTVAPLPVVPAWRVWQERRTVLHAAVHVGGHALSVAVTHLAVPQRVNGPQLDHLLGAVADRPRPAIVLGDLNRFPNTVRPAAERAGLVYVPHGSTCLVPPLVIDHVLVSPELVIRHVEVRPTEMSDHAALIVDVDVDPTDVAPTDGGPRTARDRR